MAFDKKIKLHQKGLVVIEFTIVATILFFVFFAVIGIARTMYVFNATANATRYGARLAVVCDVSARAAIQTKMSSLVPELKESNININYIPDGCDQSTCTSVTVSVSNFSVSIATAGSLQLGSVNIPSFSTTLTRESMNSANNSVCS